MGCWWDSRLGCHFAAGESAWPCGPMTAGTAVPPADLMPQEMNMDTAKLIADLIAGKWGLEELAERHDITLEELARFVASGMTLRRLAALRQLADAQTQLMLSKHRQFAVAKLYELAQGDGETARKACVDLMKLDVKNAPTATVRPPEPVWELEPIPPDPNPWGPE